MQENAPGAQWNEITGRTEVTRENKCFTGRCRHVKFLLKTLFDACKTRLIMTRIPFFFQVQNMQLLKDKEIKTHNGTVQVS